MKVLKIQNLILIEKAEIPFGEGLNILTGETGAGKSAILAALRLIAGDRADSSLIRKGADMAVIEAEFKNSLFVRREIYRSGKNRCFIDDAQVSLNELKEQIQIEMVDQNSSILGEEIKLLDLFAKLELSDFQASLQEERQLEMDLQKLLQTPQSQLDQAKIDLEQIEEIGFQEKEEEALFAEHQKLVAAQEITGKILGVAEAFTEISALKRAQHVLESCVKYDPNLQPHALQMKSSSLELEEVGRYIQSYADRLETDPKRLEVVEKRLSQIAHLKKRFGPDIAAKTQQLHDLMEQLEHLEQRIEELQDKLRASQEKNRAWAQEITAKRQQAAPLLSRQVLQELQSLNLPHAQFEIRVGSTFNDIRFLFSANLGLSPLPIAAVASGGELSRLLLALKTVLTDSQKTLVFDEIDSNVGGHTATILGEKLKKLAEQRQVICVTHFVQVAKCASHHLLVFKETLGESTFTRIQKLDEKKKELEYNRMLGHTR